MRLSPHDPLEFIFYDTLSASYFNAGPLTLIETRRVVRRAEREGRIAAAQAADLLATFAQAASTWAILEILEEIARRAEDGFPNEPVRTLDVIQLASALFLRQSFPELVIVSVDERLRANAALPGFQAGTHLEVRPGQPARRNAARPLTSSTTSVTSNTW
jgi:hypothetical protein